MQYKDNNSALPRHKIRYTYSARIWENARGNPRIFPDSKPHPYIDFMSSQCTVIVYVTVFGIQYIFDMEIQYCTNKDPMVYWV